MHRHRAWSWNRSLWSRIHVSIKFFFSHVALWATGEAKYHQREPGPVSVWHTWLPSNMQCGFLCAVAPAVLSDLSCFVCISTCLSPPSLLLLLFCSICCILSPSEPTPIGSAAWTAWNFLWCVRIENIHLLLLPWQTTYMLSGSPRDPAACMRVRLSSNLWLGFGASSKVCGSKKSWPGWAGTATPYT